MPHFSTNLESFVWQVAPTVFVLIQSMVWREKPLELFPFVKRKDTPFTIQLCNSYDRLSSGAHYWFWSCNKPNGEGLSFFTFGRDITEEERFHCIRVNHQQNLLEAVAFVNELWLSHHRLPNKGTILKHFYPGSDLLVTKWHWNLELQQVRIIE